MAGAERGVADGAANHAVKVALDSLIIYDFFRTIE
jgi:hypothetical protein